MYELLELLEEWARRHGWRSVVGFALLVVLPVLGAVAIVGERIASR